MTRKLKAAIVGSGNIGTDPMIKILRHGRHLEMSATVGIDPASDGLARAARPGVAACAAGAAGLAATPKRCRMAGGQEDMVVDVALDRKSTSSVAG